MSPALVLPLQQLVSLVARDPESATETSQYGYVPSESVGIIFVVPFGISSILHITQAAYFKIWWLLPTAALCGIGETPFLMQISSIIIAPTPLLAANFIIFARIIQRLGTEYSRLTPWRYTIVFLPCDITALVIQGVGGGLASSADDLAGSNRGANVMLGDIAFQFAVIIVFSILGADFLWHYIHDRPVHHDPTSKRGELGFDPLPVLPAD